MKVLRITRHEAQETQMEVLNKLFGNPEVVTISETLPNDSREAVKRFDELAEGFNVVEAVLPINLLEAVLKFSEFSKQGGMVIRAVTDRVVGLTGNVTFTFSHYEKVISVDIVTKPLSSSEKKGFTDLWKFR